MNDKSTKYWDNLDFFLNKALWSHIGQEKSIKIREENLIMIKNAFNIHNIEFFLE